ncbi:SIS domain-containing protein [Erysipelothrix sp. HDW6C]|uniref:SIS domain-containing protein n=1 Tax=Erysipelothrix sp. HDW6C TaxID=2714930 RepID=UPI00140E242D|nr:SIS domain-containing protein [Erysipelothrix sp. HDW6C]QIK69252.1 SIS domain-containing protein [Erysipelothrix sp. HDW6C]
MFNQDKAHWESLTAFHTANEISQQPTTWGKTFEIIKEKRAEIKAFIEQVTGNKEYDVIFTGAGTSEFVGNSLAPVLVKNINSNFKSIATTNIVVTPELYIDPKKPTLLVSFGRSGNSPESIAAVDVASIVNPNTKHLIITCNHEGKLALREDDHTYAIKLPKETNDQSFAMTSSFSNMFLAAYLAFNIDTLDTHADAIAELIRVGSEFNTSDYKVIEKLVNDFKFERIVYLGDADLNGFAQESALKMLELTAGEVVTMHNSPLGFRHGPKSIVNSKTLTVIYMKESDYVRKYQIDLIKEMSGQRDGNQIMVVDLKQDDSIAALVDVYHVINYNKSVNTDFVGLNMVMYAQAMSLYKSIDLGKTPDNPWPSGLVNRVVQGVIIYPYSYKEAK